MATLTSSAGLVATIDGTGLADLSLNGTQVLFGGLSAENASSRFGITGETSLGAVANSVVLASNASSAAVLHAHAKARVQYIYTLDGEDLTITVRVTNNTGAPITVLGFRTLIGAWTNGEHTGLLGAQTMNLLAAGLSQFHPSSVIPLAAAYRIPTTGPLTGVGVCVYPINTGLVRTLVQWAGLVDGTGAHPGAQFYIVPSAFRYPAASIPENPEAERYVPLFHPGIHPGETYTVSFGVRVSVDSSAQHLLTPYKAQFNATFGPCTYAAARDDRPVASSFQGDISTLDPVTNPYGYAVGLNRFDQSVTAWCDSRIPALVAAGCQGSIHWTLEGWDTRFPGIAGGGVNYNTDVHILPAETEANRPELLSRLQAAGLTMGRLSRTGHVRTRGQWAADGPYLIAAVDAVPLGNLLDRFDIAVAKGFTLYYCDSFPDDFNAHLLLRAIRDHLGPSILFYTETFTDIGMVYAGLFRQSSVGPQTYGNQALVELARWITPHTSVLAFEGATAFDESMLDFLYQRNVTPGVQDWALVAGEDDKVEWLAARNALYLVDNQFPNS